MVSQLMLLADEMTGPDESILHHVHSRENCDRDLKSR